jgi:serine/threonine protein kinase
MASLPMPGEGTEQQTLVMSVASATGDEQWLRRSFDTLQTLVHRNLLRLLGCGRFEPDSPFNILFHRPSRGSLREVLQEHGLDKVEQRFKVLQHTSLGLEYLHHRRIVHGELSSHSCYLDHSLNTRIMLTHPMWAAGDGLAAPRTVTAADVSVRWLPAEAILTGRWSAATDMYSYSVLLWEIFSSGGSELIEEPHSAAFPETSDAVAAVKQAGDWPALSLPPHCPKLATEIYDSCHHADALQRPSSTWVATLLLETLGGAQRWEVPRDQLYEVSKLGEGQFGKVLKMMTSLFSENNSVQQFVAVKMLKQQTSHTGVQSSTTSQAHGSVYLGFVEGETEVDDNLVRHSASGQPTTNKEARDCAETAIDAVAITETANATEEFYAEIELMKKLRHPHLVTILGVCSADAAPGRPPLLILEHLEGGGLDDWLPENGSMLGCLELLSILHQVALGLTALGRAGIVHRDLAARNVLIDAQLTVKISDYGLSRQGEDEKCYYRVQSNR